MNNSLSPSAPSVRAETAGLPQSAADQSHEVDAIPGSRSRLVQEVLPWLTSLIVHGALIVLGVATATVIMAPPKPPFQEQAAPAVGELLQQTIDTSSLTKGMKAMEMNILTQDVEPEASNGMSKAAGNKFDVDAGGGDGPEGPTSDLIGGGGRFSFGPGGPGSGPGKGPGAGEGGDWARFGKLQSGGTPNVFITREAKRIVFVCDATGTMIQKLGGLKQELMKAISSLKPYQSFNIIFFTDGGKYHIADKNGLILASADNKRQAYAFLEDVTPIGTTDPTPAIAAAFKQNADLVYFLSDGEFNNLKPYEEVVRQFDVSNKDRKCRVNAVLFETYDREAEEAMQRIAQAHGGTYRYVREAELQ